LAITQEVFACDKPRDSLVCTGRYNHNVMLYVGGSMKRIMACVLSLLLLFSSSCATLLKGTTDNMTVMSDPVGVKVTVNDEPRGTTPVSFTVPSKQDLNIHLSKDGYEPQDVYSPANFRWGWELWSFVAWVIPFVVDLSDGAAWGHDQATITAHLEPVAHPTPGAPAAHLPSPPAQASQTQSASSSAKSDPR
jgi:PEGA domain